MAWDSKSGTLDTTTLSDDEYWSLFNYVFVGSAKKTTTYKFALIKAILDNLLNFIVNLLIAYLFDYLYFTIKHI